jgi:DNA-binding SARP family transcriptional activator
MSALLPSTPTPPQLLLFGPPAIVAGDSRHDLPASAPTWLLAALGLAGDWLTREQLQLLFWPDASAADAQRQLRVTLHRSRQLLQAVGAHDALEAERTRLRLNLACDVPQFRAALARGDRAAALALHRQPLLGGQGLRGLAELDGWFSRQRDSLHVEWRAAALSEAAALEAAGQAGPAVALLQQQLQHDLLAEDAVQALLRLAAPAGERIAALALFERFRDRVQAELGLAPMPATLALAEALRQEQRLPPAPAPASWSSALPPVLQRLPLIGRETELAQLQQRRAALTVVVGEPGVGKSRLLQSACPQALWLRGREGLRLAPLQALVLALRERLDTVRSLPLSRVQRLELARLLPALVPDELPPPSDADEPGLVAAAAALLRHWPEPLVLDDLQWLDQASCEALGAALAAGATGWLASLRPAEIPPATRAWLDGLEADGRVEHLPLPALGAPAVAALAQHVAGREVPRFAAWLVQRTGGNPFFAIESLAALFDEGRLDQRRGDWSDTLAAWPDEAPPTVPPRVAGVVRRRLACLGEATQRVLAIAAVAGDAVALPVLAELAGLSAYATAQALAEAQAAGLLAGRQFAHDLVRQTLLAHTPEPLLAVLHAGVARRLADVLPPHAVAQHWWAAGDAAQALDATLAAAQQDVERGLYSAAERLLLAAIERTAAAPDGLDVARLHVLMAHSLHHRRALDEAEAHARAALAAMPMPRTRVHALVECFELALTRGQLAEAEAALAQAQALDPELPTLWLDAGKLAHFRGDARTCAQMTGRYLAWRRQQPPGAELAVALTSQGVALDMLGEYAAAQAAHREALAIARRLGARHIEIEATNNLVMSLGEGGDDEAAVRVGLPALAFGDDYPIDYLVNNVAGSLLLLGRLDEAERLYLRQMNSANPSLICSAAARRLEIAAQRGVPAAERAAAVAAVFQAMAGTDFYTVQAGAVVALLNHGSPADVQRALTWLRDEPVYPGLQQRLDAALAAHGLSPVSPPRSASPAHH